MRNMPNCRTLYRSSVSGEYHPRVTTFLFSFIAWSSCLPVTQELWILSLIQHSVLQPPSSILQTQSMSQYRFRKTHRP